MANTFRCTIVTPSSSIFDAQVAYASVPAWDGQVGIMDGQSPILSRLGTGSLRVDGPDGQASWFLIDGGFAQVQGNVLTLLTDYAVPAGDLSMEEAQAELAEANARVGAGGEALEQVIADQSRAMAKMAVIRSAAG